jgi:hypothetical protein
LGVMTKAKRRVLIAVAVLAIGGLAAAGYIYYQADKVGREIGKQIAEEIIKPRPLPGVVAQRWAQLKVGMTKEEVQKLLGDPPSKSVVSNASSRSEFWEWGFTYGLLGPVAHEKAFAVYFDPDGKVSSFHSPQVAEK